MVQLLFESFFTRKEKRNEKNALFFFVVGLCVLLNFFPIFVLLQVMKNSATKQTHLLLFTKKIQNCFVFVKQLDMKSMQTR